jgi:hypothetical protein
LPVAHRVQAIGQRALRFRPRNRLLRHPTDGRRRLPFIGLRPVCHWVRVVPLLPRLWGLFGDQPDVPSVVVKP